MVEAATFAAVVTARTKQSESRAVEKHDVWPPENTHKTVQLSTMTVPSVAKLWPASLQCEELECHSGAFPLFTVTLDICHAILTCTVSLPEQTTHCALQRRDSDTSGDWQRCTPCQRRL